MKFPMFGIPDDQFLFTVPRKGLITKSEIRVLSLSKLNLGPGQVLWDIGAGSGSVGIEAARLVGDLTVVAIEKDKEDYDCLLKNIETFGVASRFHPIHGKAPELLPASPKPDRVFIGGSGGKMAPLLDHARSVLPSGLDDFLSGDQGSNEIDVGPVSDNAFRLLDRFPGPKGKVFFRAWPEADEQQGSP